MFFRHLRPLVAWGGAGRGARSQARPLLTLGQEVARCRGSNGGSYYALPCLGAGAAALVALASSVGLPPTTTTDCSAGVNFIADAAEKAAPAVVNITVRGPRFEGTGSGFIITSEGLTVTNAHVVAPAMSNRNARLTVTMLDGKQFPARVHSLDVGSDIALVEIRPERNTRSFPVSRIGSSSALRAGEWVVALGSPLHLQNTVTAGIVSSTARHGSEFGMEKNRSLHDFIQTDAAINQGNSGGPLVNLEGKVIGINTIKIGGSAISGISFAIPMDSAWQVIEQLRSSRRVVRPYLGIRFTTMDRGGVQIVEVKPGSPAEVAGLAAGDTILEFDGHPVRRNADVVGKLGYAVERDISVKVRKKNMGGEMTLTIRPSAGPRGGEAAGRGGIFSSLRP